MPEKILYYLGAGASAQSLPLAKSVGNSIQPDIPGLSFELRRMTFEPVIAKLSEELNKGIVENMKSRFEDLAIKADEFGDVDTYAKYLHLMHPSGKDLDNLKRTLGEFFSIRQLLDNARDKRYLSWLVSIMSNKRFPENVKILNWNYDFQIQLAAGQIGDLEDVEHTGNSFTYSPSILFYLPNLDPTFSDFSHLSLIHLNGIAGFSKQKDLRTGSVFQRDIKKQAKQIISFLNERSLQPQINFAWEKANYHSSLTSHIKSMISHTTIMIVIGYSFPFFNREIDKEIFAFLKSQSTFRKIYYQDPVLNGEQLRSQFDLHAGFEIVHIKNVNNFHIPFEY